MNGRKLLVCAVLMLAAAPLAYSAPKQSSSGETCTKSGTVRRDGKDASTGEKLNCQWDYCTYCGTKDGKIDCSILKTEYSNPTDCHPAARIPNRGGMTIMRNPPTLKSN